MKIRVRYENGILGNGVFWEGDARNISEIRNLCARIAARRVLETRKPQSDGMWIAEPIKEPKS